jgi:electron transport complex protein RnfB
VNLAERIDALLPQTQCERCGFPGCRPYADAIAQGSAAINLCEPGGAEVIPPLAAMLGLPVIAPAHAVAATRIARIREEDCIGCARCLPACPVDAILGARRFGHTVIREECTGCGLCLPPCPVDCIVMEAPADDWRPPSAEDNRRRYRAHLARQAQRAAARRGTSQSPADPGSPPRPDAEPIPGADATRPAAPGTMAERRAAMIVAARLAAAARRSRA